jgi:hypothetical protein
LTSRFPSLRVSSPNSFPNILRPRLEVLEREAYPSTPPFGQTMGVLVRAETEAEARLLAQTRPETKVRASDVRHVA